MTGLQPIPVDTAGGRHRAGRRPAPTPTTAPFTVPGLVQAPGAARPAPGKDTLAVRRYQITPDGRWYRFTLGGRIIAAGVRHEGLLEFWTLNSGQYLVDRDLAVFWDEQTIPGDAEHVQSVIAGRLVWHLFQRDIVDA